MFFNSQLVHFELDVSLIPAVIDARKAKLRGGAHSAARSPRVLAARHSPGHSIPSGRNRSNLVQYVVNSGLIASPVRNCTELVYSLYCTWPVLLESRIDDRSSRPLQPRSSCTGEPQAVLKMQTLHSMDVEALDPLRTPGDGESVIEEEEGAARMASVGYIDILKQFSLLGWTAFGGPAAHIALFQTRLVERLRWMPLPMYLEIFALCQCLPGPASTKVSIALGVMKKGLLGGLMSGTLFQYPGAILMTAIGAFAAKKLENPQGWLKGIAAGVAAVGVALVASASKSLCKTMCAPPLLATICTMTAAIAFYWPKPYTFPAVILGSGVLTIASSFYKKQTPKKAIEVDTSTGKHGFGMFGGAMLITTWITVLVVTLVMRRASKDPSPLLQWWEVFYRTGSIIYGGGQVVLPMLYTDLVKQDCTGDGTCRDAADSWVTSTQFYAGLGLQQALPGPLFNFSAYLGTILALNHGYFFLVGVVISWLGLLLPGIMLLFGSLPFWTKFRNWSIYNRALPGLNAAGIGLIVTSVFSLTVGAYKQSPFPKTSICIGILAFTSVDQLHWLEPLVVLGGAMLGVVAWALHLS